MQAACLNCYGIRTTNSHTQHCPLSFHSFAQSPVFDLANSPKAHFFWPGINWQALRSSHRPYYSAADLTHAGGVSADLGFSSVPLDPQPGGQKSPSTHTPFLFICPVFMSICLPLFVPEPAAMARCDQNSHDDVIV